LATWHILALTWVDAGHLKHKLSVNEVSRPVEAACKMVAKSTQHTVPSTV